MEMFPNLLAMIGEHFLKGDSLICNHDFERLIEITALELEQMIQHVHKVWYVCDQVYKVPCVASDLESPLKKLVQIGAGMLETYRSFINQHLPTEPLPSLQIDTLPEGELFRCSSIPSHLDKLVGAVQKMAQGMGPDAMLAMIGNIPDLSYSPPLILALEKCHGSLQQIHTICEKIRFVFSKGNPICQVCNAMGSYNEPLKHIIEHSEQIKLYMPLCIRALQTPRCCANVQQMSEKFNTLFGRITANIGTVFDNVFEDVKGEGNVHNPLPKDFFVGIGKAFFQIGSAIAQLTCRISDLEDQMEKRWCWSSALWPELSAIQLGMENLDHLVTEHSQISAEGIALMHEPAPDLCRWPQELLGLVDKLNVWRQYSQRVVKEGTQLLYDASQNMPIEVLDALMNGSITPNIERTHYFFHICDALSFWAPAFLHISYALHQLAAVWMHLEQQQKYLCSACSAVEAIQTLTILEQKVNAATEPLLVLADMFERVRAHNLAKYSTLMLQENSPAWSVVTADDSAVYASKTNPGLHITMLKPSKVPADANVDCTPFFSCENQQVLWDAMGNIIAPVSVKGYNINDFEPLNLIGVMQNATRALNLIEDGIKKISELFHKRTVWN